MRQAESVLKVNLRVLVGELKDQAAVGSTFLAESLSFVDQILFLQECVEDANEYGIAYESIICLLEQYDFCLSGSASVRLVEIALILGFKTTRPEDSEFGFRRG